MSPELLHCRVKGCKSVFHVKNFEDGMKKLREHRKEKHPTLFRKSVKKAVATRTKNR